MMCERCQQQEATIHLTQTRQGKMTEHHLCDACARELGIGHHVSDYFGTIGSLIGSGLLGGVPGGGSIFNTAGGIPAFGAQPTRNVTCPVCGQTFDDFRHSGLFGCSPEALAMRRLQTGRIPCPGVSRAARGMSGAKPPQQRNQRKSSCCRPESGT